MSSRDRTRVYVGRLPNRTTETELNDLFSRYGKINHVDIKTGGYAFVEMDDYRDAEDCVRKLDGYNLNGNRIIVEFSRGPKRGPRGPPSRSDYRVSIEGLPRDMSWQDLKDHFRKAGDVIFADVYPDRSGRHKGCVEFRAREDMHRADLIYLLKR